jgi:AraC-like DNA-binding protein
MEQNNGNKLYIPFQLQFQMSGFDVSVKYLERLDETCVEFTHTHLNHEIYYILEGCMRMRVGGGEQLLLPNDFLLLPPGASHGAVYDPGEIKKYVVFVFGLHKNAEALSNRHLPQREFMERLDKALDGKPYLLARDKNGCRELLAALERESLERQPGWQMLLADYCREYLIRLFRNFLSPGPAGGTADDSALLSGGQTNLAVEITKYMHQHYRENISLEDISKVFHITPRHITRLFSDYFGTSFKKTLSIYRLNYAKNYLLSTDKSVEEIAGLVGLSAAQTLYRLFKENEGMTISEYRARHRQAGEKTSN